MNYKELVEHLKECGTYGFKQEECAAAASAITDLLARAEAAEAAQETLQKAMEEYKAQAEKAAEIASDLCDDFTDFVVGGVHNAAPYCANRRPECVNAYGWCNGDNSVCRGFLPKSAGIKKEE